MSIKVVTGSNTVVKKITVGTPVRRVTGGSFNIQTIDGVNMTNLNDGALLIYNSNTNLFDATNQIDNENTNFNGGNF